MLCSLLYAVFSGTAKAVIGLVQRLRRDREWLMSDAGYRWLRTEKGKAWAEENGLEEQPSLQKRTIGKMGLKTAKGLRIEN